ncbi:MAG TPA: hypothetical protein VK179_20515 [Bacteroidales bacterium]|nr:hypothetical protein [Bacteroidales bacterium]
MKDKKHIVKKAIKELPAFKMPDPALWERIEAQLDCESSLKNKLPSFKAPGTVWEKIEKELDKNPKRFLTVKRMQILAAAAVVIVVSALALYGIIKSREAMESQGSETVQITSPVYDPALCENNPDVCKSPAFIDLEKQLGDVKIEINELEKYMKPDDPQLMKYFLRLENTRVEIEKKMVKMLIQS